MFETIANIYNTILYTPLFNLLVGLYNIIPGHDFGVAIIVLTIIIRVLIAPISAQAVKSQKNLQKLQPLIKDIQNKYKDDKEKQAREMLELYKKERINPFSGIFLALLQIPILIALYQVFWDGLKKEKLSALYNFVLNPVQINPLFFQIIDLSKPNMVIAILAGTVQYFQTKMLMSKNPKTPNSSQSDISNIMQKQMLYFFPIFTVVILISLPSALGLYWVVGGLFSIVQQYMVFKDKEQEKK